MTEIIAGYRISEKIYESACSLVCRTEPKRGKPRVILKILRQDYPSPEARLRYQNEFEILERLGSESIVRVFGLEPFRNTVALLDEETNAMPGKNERILVVDDETEIVAMLKVMLERLGYRAVARSQVADALEAFRATPAEFDLVITDMSMPDMNGVAFSKKLKEIRPDIRIILCTGFSEQIDDERAKALGIHGYLTKPVLQEKLAKTIRNILEKLPTQKGI